MLNPQYNHETDSLDFMYNGQRCGVSYEALSDHFGATRRNTDDCKQAFYNNKTRILGVVERKYLSDPEVEIIIVTNMDFVVSKDRKDRLPIKIRD